MGSYLEAWMAPQSMLESLYQALINYDHGILADYEWIQKLKTDFVEEVVKRFSIQDRKIKFC